MLARRAGPAAAAPQRARMPRTAGLAAPTDAASRPATPAPWSSPGPRCAACSGRAAAVHCHRHVAQQHDARTRYVADNPGSNAKPPAPRAMCAAPVRYKLAGCPGACAR
jgi:hypothetical protein